ncbi:MAG: radical SAM protein [Calditrichia bacterium]
MSASDSSKEEMIRRNKNEYGGKYNQLKWLSRERAGRAEREREDLLHWLSGHIQLGYKNLLHWLSGHIQLGYKNTKLDVTQLSPGCRICGEGSWSCLFINGKCNCRCFYCPARQDEVDIPTTNTVSFSKSRDYVDYIERFDFRGVSISGGEPLLTPERTIDFLTAVKERFGARVHTWLYTNGTLATNEILQKLQQAGLDEIRFDIGAAKYHLKKVRLAAGLIRNITIEIPGIPDDFELMKYKLKEMRDAGVKYLNLHQLRLTPHNFEKLSSKNYTFLHGEKVTVLESELTVLKLMKYNIEQKINLPVNYCSFVYKNRFQRAAARRRNALFVKKDYEDITENGYIRSLFLAGSSESISRQIRIFQEGGGASNSWFANTGRDRLYFSESLWKLVDFEEFRLHTAYFEAKILQAITYRNPFSEIRLNENKSVFVERIKSGPEIDINSHGISLFETAVIKKEEIGDSMVKWGEILNFEFVRQGLQEYY